MSNESIFVGVMLKWLRDTSIATNYYYVHRSQVPPSFVHLVELYPVIDNCPLGCVTSLMISIWPIMNEVGVFPTTTVFWFVSNLTTSYLQLWTYKMSKICGTRHRTRVNIQWLPITSPTIQDNILYCGIFGGVIEFCRINHTTQVGGQIAWSINISTLHWANC